jgi:hypothetical protein
MATSEASDTELSPLNHLDLISLIGRGSETVRVSVSPLGGPQL